MVQMFEGLTVKHVCFSAQFCKSHLLGLLVARLTSQRYGSHNFVINLIVSWLPTTLNTCVVFTPTRFCVLHCILSSGH